MKLRHSIAILAFGLSSTFAGRSALAAPVFASVGQTFQQSTGCSPHSDYLSLAVTTQDLTLVRISPVAGRRTLVLHLEGASITNQVVEYGPGPGQPKVTTIELRPDQPAPYLAVLTSLRQGIVQLKTANGCFPDLPVLDDVVAYLDSLVPQT